MGKIAVVIPKFGLVGGAENFASELTTRIASDRRCDVDDGDTVTGALRGNAAMVGPPT
jgi:hypothetical protein